MMKKSKIDYNSWLQEIKNSDDKDIEILKLEEREFNNWCEDFEPSNEADVAVHIFKKKTLKSILNSLLGKNFPQILILYGPPGCGKSTLLKILVSQLHGQVIELDDIVTDTEDEERDEIFFSIMMNARYSSLNGPKSSFNVLVLKDLPQSVISKYDEFIEFLNRLTETSANNFIICIIISTINETNVEKFSSSEQNLITGLINSGFVNAQLEFNVIANSLIKKALKRIISILSRNKQSFDLSNARSYLDGIIASCNGDLRLAINQLQFLIKSGSNATVSPEDFGRKDLKDSGIGIFPALGKILYSKREDNFSETSFLPFHLSAKKRKVLSFNPEVNWFTYSYLFQNILDKSGDEPETLVAWLYENYINFLAENLSLDTYSIISDIFSWTDSYLSGSSCLSWKMGFNSELGDISAKSSAGKHYVSVTVARTFIFNQKLDSDTKLAFKSIKPPTSTVLTKFTRLLNANSILIVLSRVFPPNETNEIYECFIRSKNDILVDWLGYSKRNPFLEIKWLKTLTEFLDSGNNRLELKQRSKLLQNMNYQNQCRKFGPKSQFLSEERLLSHFVYNEQSSYTIDESD